MKIPNLEEIILTSLDTNDLIMLIEKHKIGSNPVYANLSHLEFDRLLDVLDKVEDTLEYLNLSPKFPYPFYIITQHENFKTSFPIINDVKFLPRYYINKTGKMATKEQKILDKIEILCSQIKNQDVAQRLEDYKISIMPQKFIKQLANESSFLERVLEKIEGTNE